MSFPTCVRSALVPFFALAHRPVRETVVNYLNDIFMNEFPLLLCFEFFLAPSRSSTPIHHLCHDHEWSWTLIAVACCRSRRFTGSRFSNLNFVPINSRAHYTCVYVRIICAQFNCPARFLCKNPGRLSRCSPSRVAYLPKSVL